MVLNPTLMIGTGLGPTVSAATRVHLRGTGEWSDPLKIPKIGGHKTDNVLAGITLQDVAGSNTSVYAGSFFRDYHESLIKDPDNLPRFLLMGTGAAMASNRLSHFFDLRGPSMSVDTGCSTTLTALHQGCQSLRTGESDMSIVGGANIMFNPDMFLAMSSMT